MDRKDALRLVLLAESDKLMKEDRSISDEVLLMTKEVAQKILKSIETSRPKEYENKNVVYKDGEFNYSYLNVSFTVKWEYFNLKDNNLKKIDFHRNPFADIENNTLNIRIIGRNNKIVITNLLGNLQHEIFHFFETNKRKKIPYRNIIMYNRAVNLLKFRDRIDDVLYSMGLIVYASFPFEQRAFANCSYQYLMQHKEDFYNDYKNAITKTQLFDKLTDITDGILKIENAGGEDSEVVKIGLNLFEITYAQFLKIYQSAKDGIMRNIGRIRSKAIDDRFKDGVFFWTPEKRTKTEEQYRKKQLMEINKKYFRNGK